MMDKQLVLKPRLSEKTYALSLTGNVFAFEIPASANKLTVAQAVETQFAVTVTNVRIVNVKGKATRTIRKGGRQTKGQRSDIKKAYVTLKAGDSLPFFETEETEPAKTDKKVEKTDKKADKKVAKEKK